MKIIIFGATGMIGAGAQAAYRRITFDLTSARGRVMWARVLEGRDINAAGDGE